MNFSTIIAGDVLELEFTSSMKQIYITENKRKQKIDCISLTSNTFSLILNGRIYHLSITKELNGYAVTVDHHTHFVEIKDRSQLLLEKFNIQGEVSSQSSEVYAQIPGLVSQIFVKVGDKVKIGKKLCILEAMKMENEITSPKNGIITHIHIDSSNNVEKGDLLMEIID